METPNNVILDDNYIEKYGLDQSNEAFLVNYFEEIGWFDPLPSLSFLTSNAYEPPEDEMDYTCPVYPESRMGRDMPRQIYIPKKLLMFTMMRSCIDVKSP